jgi:hypothetical protein
MHACFVSVTKTLDAMVSYLKKCMFPAVGLKSVCSTLVVEAIACYGLIFSFHVNRQSWKPPRYAAMGLALKKTFVNGSKKR